ncbi:anti-anti-sigma regulatory factor [Thiobaca trueperi]|uniref:Anti-anti-sigma regulatory factor n=2 Tax=Thiobaca trueperi TaxID=127458 RepID=A0A4R3N4N6_9GAMM|nr:anti-anti-sigma regulatory factor [Thiobaca trueperi]
MPMSTSFIPSEDRLDLSFHGDLDLTMSEDVCQVFASIPASLRTCIMDLTGLDRVFDSGLALLWMLNERLKRIGAIVVVLSDHPDIQRRIPLIMSNALNVVPKDSPSARHASLSASVGPRYLPA